MVNQQKVIQAGNDFYSVIVNALTNENGVHTETAISTAARMSGTFLLRSFKLPIDNFEPGLAVFSDEANDKGPLLVNVLGSVLQQLAICIDYKEVNPGSTRDMPHLTVVEAQSLVEEPLTAIKEKYQLTYEEAAQAAAVTAALFIGQCASIVNPNVGFSIAVFGFVEGSKTVPRKRGGPLFAARWARSRS
jgi:hypothetical protein